MGKKYGIISMGVIALFVGLALHPASAGESTENKSSEVMVEYSYVADDGSIFKEKITISEAELQELQEQLSGIFEKIKSKFDVSEIEKMISEITILAKHPKLRGLILKMMRMMPRRSMAFVMSYGSSSKLNPFKSSEIKIKDRFSFWRYSGAGAVKPKTFILRPFRKNFEMLQGTQIGVMGRFNGLYIYIARKMPKMSYTFFMGGTNFIKGIDLGI
jgi:hypothetical protein